MRKEREKTIETTSPQCCRTEIVENFLHMNLSNVVQSIFCFKEVQNNLSYIF